uniref:ATP synthase complex subunit 8 n=1 Tax=Draco maculatus TaxID=89026 RepID=A0A6F8CP25_9SAUR|nr:ATP synthase F0 subunit 8 [Draco maculatus]
MPQLNPDPWLVTMMITWLLMLALMTKIISACQTTTPTPQDQKALKGSLTWPWH